MGEMNFYFIGLILLLLCNWYSRYVMQNAINLLDNNKKVELMTLFQKDNRYGGLIAIVLLVIFLVFTSVTQIPMMYLLTGIFVLLIAKILFTYISKLGKLKANNYPIEYIKKYNFAALIQIGGFLLFIVITMFMLI